ncbi:MAG: hypothetical protein FP815_13630, partial [Desulfobulbaceae bacterium]|nr:hypothetical protein [Desulfobulbaceae bacterium]
MALALTLTKNVSLQTKIMVVFICSFVLLLLVTSAMHFQGMAQRDSALKKSVRLGHTIAVDSVLTDQRQYLEKALTGILNTRETAVFLSDPAKNNTAGLIMKGLYLTMQTQHYGRLTLYDSNYRVLLQEHDEKLPSRGENLPERFKTVYAESAKSFENQYYFRQIEPADGNGPVEYCGVTVITDVDDKVVGFVEVSIMSHTWVELVAHLTESDGALFDQATSSFSFAMDTDLYNQINKVNIPINDGSSTYQLDSSYYVSDKMPLTGPDGTVEGWLFLSQDKTVAIARESKINLISTLLVVAVVLGSIMGTIFVIRKGIIIPVLSVVDNLRDSGSA